MISKNKKVSIVVPIYNAEKYLDECIISIVKQDYDNLEIFLIDDGSTDGSRHICEDWKSKDSRITLYSQKNQGVSAARNKGIELSTGEYIVFVDSDDVIDKSYINTFMEAKMKLGEDILPIAGFADFTNETPKTQKVKEYKLIERGRLITLYFDKYINSPCNKLYSLEIIKKNSISFPKDVTIGEDLIFNLSYIGVTSEESFCLTVNNEYYYRKHSTDTLSRKYYKNFYDTEMQQFELLCETADKVNIDEENRRLLEEIRCIKLINLLRYTMSKENRASFFEKMKYNGYILKAGKVGYYLKNRKMGSKIWKLVWPLYCTNNYYLVYPVDLLMRKIKGK